MAEAPFFVEVPFSVPGCGCLWLLVDVCGSLCGRVVLFFLRLALAECIPPFWWFFALGSGFVWGALGLSFVCFLPVGTLLVCTPALSCSGVGLVFLEGHSLPEMFRGLAPFCWVLPRSLPLFGSGFGHLCLLRLLLC